MPFRDLVVLHGKPLMRSPGADGEGLRLPNADMTLVLVVRDFRPCVRAPMRRACDPALPG